MKKHPRTPPMWRAWVETQLENPATVRMLELRGLTVEVVREVASAEAGLARYGIVRVPTPVLAELLQQPVGRVMKARLALVHLRAVVFSRVDDGVLVRELVMGTTATG